MSHSFDFTNIRRHQPIDSQSSSSSSSSSQPTQNEGGLLGNFWNKYCSFTTPSSSSPALQQRASHIRPPATSSSQPHANLELPPSEALVVPEGFDTYLDKKFEEREGFWNRHPILALVLPKKLSGRAVNLNNSSLSRTMERSLNCTLTPKKTELFRWGASLASAWFFMRNPGKLLLAGCGFLYSECKHLPSLFKKKMEEISLQYPRLKTALPFFLTRQKYPENMPMKEKIFTEFGKVVKPVVLGTVGYCTASPLMLFGAAIGLPLYHMATKEDRLQKIIIDNILEMHQEINNAVGSYEYVVENYEGQVAKKNEAICYKVDIDKKLETLKLEIGVLENKESKDENDTATLKQKQDELKVVEYYSVQAQNFIDSIMLTYPTKATPVYKPYLSEAYKEAYQRFGGAVKELFENLNNEGPAKIIKTIEEIRKNPRLLPIFSGTSENTDYCKRTVESLVGIGIGVIEGDLKKCIIENIDRHSELPTLKAVITTFDFINRMELIYAPAWKENRSPSEFYQNTSSEFLENSKKQLLNNFFEDLEQRIPDLSNTISFMEQNLSKIKRNDFINGATNFVDTRAYNKARTDLREKIQLLKAICPNRIRNERTFEGDSVLSCMSNFFSS